MTTINTSTGAIKRRKYRFADRAAAEDELAKVEQERQYGVRYTRAVYLDAVEWLANRGGKCGYRVGLFDTHAHHTPKVVVVWWPQADRNGNRQEPDIRVHDAYEWCDTQAHAFVGSAIDDEISALRDFATQIRQRLFAWTRETVNGSAAE